MKLIWAYLLLAVLFTLTACDSPETIDVPNREVFEEVTLGRCTFRRYIDVLEIECEPEEPVQDDDSTFRF